MARCSGRALMKIVGKVLQVLGGLFLLLMAWSIVWSIMSKLPLALPLALKGLLSAVLAGGFVWVCWRYAIVLKIAGGLFLFLIVLIICSESLPALKALAAAMLVGLGLVCWYWLWNWYARKRH